MSVGPAIRLLGIFGDVPVHNIGWLHGRLVVLDDGTVSRVATIADLDLKID